MAYVELSTVISCLASPVEARPPATLGLQSEAEASVPAGTVVVDAGTAVLVVVVLVVVVLVAMAEGERALCRGRRSPSGLGLSGRQAA